MKKIEPKSQDLAGLFSLFTETTVERQQEEQNKFKSIKDTLLRDLVQSVPVDLSEILELVNLLADIDEPANEKDYQALFFSHWIKLIPPSIAKDIVNKNKSLDGEIHDYVLGMGSKIKAVRSGLCVSHAIELACPDCYFWEICPNSVND